MSTFNQALENGIGAVGDYLRLSFDDVAVQQSHCAASSGAVVELEGKLRQHYRMKHALCVSNATTALYVLGLALELKDCDFVTTPLTYGATIAGMLLLGNRPRFADTDAQTMTLEPDSAARAITPATKAIISVDMFGVPADSRSLRRIADERGLWLISDSSQSLGATRDGMPAGVFADALVVSFTAGKTLFAGEGGAIVTNNSGLYEKLVYWSQHPLRQRLELGLHLDNEFAFNARISPLSAVWANAMFVAALKKLRLLQKEYRCIIGLLNKSGLTEPIDFTNGKIESAYFRLVASWKDGPREDPLTGFLLNHGIKAAIEPLPVRLLYKQPFVLARRLDGEESFDCANAEMCVRKGFVLRPA